MKDNIMRKIKIEKVVLNCGGTADKLDKGVKLLKVLTARNPIKTISKKRIPDFGVRPGLETGCKVTLTGEKAIELLKRMLQAKDNTFSKKQFNDGTFSFGIPEYIEIPGVSFQRDVGIFGLDVSVRLSRSGYSVEEKKIKSGKIPLRQKITKDETIDFMKKNFGIKLSEEVGKMRK